MNAEIKTDITTQTQPKSKRLSSFIWILVLWGIVRLYSELHPVDWTHLFLYSVNGLGVIPASIALFISMSMKTTDAEKFLRWTAFVIIFGGLSVGILLQVMGFNNFREICIAAHWTLLIVGIWISYSSTFTKGEAHGN